MANGNIFNNVSSQLGGGAPASTLQAVQNVQAATAGKAADTGGATPRRSTLAASQAQAETREGLRDVAQQSQAVQMQQASQAQAQQQQFDEQTLKLKEERTNAQDRFTQQAAGILQSFQQRGQELDLQKAKAQVEQLGFYLRLSNDKYIDKLQAEGQRSRLDSSINFREALQKSIFQEEMELFDDDMEFRRMMNAEQRDFETMLTNIDIDTALRVAEASAKQANTEMAFQGLGGLISGGTKIAETYQEGKITEDTARAKRYSDFLKDY